MQPKHRKKQNSALDLLLIQLVLYILQNNENKVIVAAVILPALKRKIGSHRAPQNKRAKEQHDTVMIVQCTFARAVRD